MNHLLNNSKALALVLATDGFLHLRIEGISMEPAISNNDRITVIPKSPLVNGCLYLFNYRNRLLVHRLVTSSNNEAVFMGDNNRCSEQIPVDAILGRIDLRESRVVRLPLAVINVSCYTLINRVVSERNRVYLLLHRFRIKGICCIYAIKRILEKYPSFKSDYTARKISDNEKTI